jgi:dynactin 6
VAAPKPPLSLSSRAVIASHASITGVAPVSIGAYVILNPYAKVISTCAPVVIEEGCIIWEKGTVGIAEGSIDGDEKADDAAKAGTKLGKHVVVESMALVEAREVGEGTWIQSGARISVGCVIGKVRVPFLFPLCVCVCVGFFPPSFFFR